MNINEFANLHNQHHRTVSIYIKRHPELFDGHIEDCENQKILDNEAIRILEKQYPLPKPVPMVENPETQQKYINALEQINYLQNQLLHVREQLQEYKSLKLLLEEKNNENQEIKDQVKSLSMELVCLQVEQEKRTIIIKSKEKDFDELNLKYEKLKNRGLWDRIVNKD